MNPIVVIALSAIKEHSRRKLLALFFFGSLIVTGLLYYLVTSQEGASLFGSDERSFIVSIVSTGALGFFAVIVAITVAMGNIAPAMADGQAQAVLARPLARWQWGLGKLAGSVGILWTFCLVLAVELAIVLAASGGSGYGELFAHWAVVAFNLTVVIAVVHALSAMFTVPIIAGALGFVAYQVMGAIEGLKLLVDNVQITGPLGTGIKALWYLSPKFLHSPLERSQLRRVAGDIQTAGNDLGLVAWAIGYLLLLVLFGMALTERREA